MDIDSHLALILFEKKTPALEINPVSQGTQQTFMLQKKEHRDPKQESVDHKKFDHLNH